MKNIIGIDKDQITFTEAKNLQNTIEKQEHLQTLLWKTKHGYHLELIYTKPVTKKKNFLIRQKYGDCSERIHKSKKRGEPYDILFTIKDGHWRKLVLD